MRRFRYFFVGIFALMGVEVSSQSLNRFYLEAEEAFLEEHYEEALTLYNIILGIDSLYMDTPYKIEICKLLSDRQYKNISLFNSFRKKMQIEDKFYFYWKGRIHLEAYQFEEAIQSFQIFLRSKEKKKENVIEEVKRWLKWSTRAKEFMDNPADYEIHLLDEGINTQYAELSPIFITQNDELLFLSDRADFFGGKFQIYHTKHTGDRNWSKPTIVEDLGIFARDNASIEVVDEDGRLFYFKKDKGGNLFFSEPIRDSNGWSPPTEFDSKISATDLSSHFFINEHEDFIIFAKNVGTSKKKNLDLFRSFKDPSKGNWSKPAPLSSSVNSGYNEDSPYLSPDEKKLYFASDGHETMGGYDIFVSEVDPEKFTWSEPKNLGFPINSPDDEMHFKLNPDQVSGYFTSNRLNTFGDFDIFFFWEIHKVTIKGRIIDEETDTPITDARIFFRPLAYADLYYFSPIDENGQYQTDITADDVFVVEIKQDNGEIVELDQLEIHATDGTNTTYIKDFYVNFSKKN